MHSSIPVCEIKTKRAALATKYLKYLKLFDFCKTDIMLGMQILKQLDEGVRNKFIAGKLLQIHFSIHPFFLTKIERILI
jgi:hypothetical protein